jgi:hypothetical protein
MLGAYDDPRHVRLPQTVVDRSTGGVTRQFWDPTKVVLDSIISPEGLVSRFGYDAKGNREIESLGPDTTTFAYDSHGLVKSVTDAGGHLLRRLTVTAPDNQA